MSEQHLSQEELEIKEQVWKTADEFLGYGYYPTRDEICQALSKDFHAVNKHFFEWKKANPKPALTVRRNNSVSKSQSSSAHTEIPNRVADKKVQYMAAGELILIQQLYRHYQKTRQFSDPDVQKQVDEALSQTAAQWKDETENFSLEAMLASFGN